MSMLITDFKQIKTILKIQNANLHSKQRLNQSQTTLKWECNEINQKGA